MKNILLFILILLPLVSFAQTPPPGANSGSISIKNSDSNTARYLYPKCVDTEHSGQDCDKFEVIYVNGIVAEPIKDLSFDKHYLLYGLLHDFNEFFEAYSEMKHKHLGVMQTALSSFFSQGSEVRLVTSEEFEFLLLFFNDKHNREISNSVYGIPVSQILNLKVGTSLPFKNSRCYLVHTGNENYYSPKPNCLYLKISRPGGLSDGNLDKISHDSYSDTYKVNSALVLQKFIGNHKRRCGL